MALSLYCMCAGKSLIPCLDKVKPFLSSKTWQDTYKHTAAEEANRALKGHLRTN
jgi:hypothetical protein